MESIIWCSVGMAVSLCPAAGREILLWEFKTGRKLKTLIGFENNEVKCVAVSGDGKTLYCATSKELRHWDIDTGEYRGITNLAKIRRRRSGVQSGRRLAGALESSGN